MATPPLNARQVYKNWLNDRVMDAKDIPWVLGNVPRDPDWAIWDAHVACASVGVQTTAPQGLAWLGIAQQVLHLAFEADVERIFYPGAGWQLVAGNNCADDFGSPRDARCEEMQCEGMQCEEILMLDCERGDLTELAGTAAAQAMIDATPHTLSDDDRFYFAGQAAVAAFGQTPVDAALMTQGDADVVATCSDDGVIRLYDRKQLDQFATDLDVQQGYSWPTLELAASEGADPKLQILGGDRVSDVVHVIDPAGSHPSRTRTGHNLPDVEVQRIHREPQASSPNSVLSQAAWATRAGGSVRTWTTAVSEPLTEWKGPEGYDINSWLMYRDRHGTLTLCAHLTAADDLDGATSWLGWWAVATNQLLKRTDLPGYAELIFAPTHDRPTDFIACIQEPPRITHWDGDNHTCLGEVNTSTQCFAAASATPTADGTIALVTVGHIEWYSLRGGLHEPLDVADSDAGIRQQMSAGPFGQGVALGALPDGRTYYAWLEGLRSVVRFVFSDNPHDLHSAFLTWIEPVAFTALGGNLLVRGVHGAALLDLAQWAGEAEASTS